MTRGGVFLYGAAVLVLELVGARLLAPACGASAAVWAAVLTVTLLALAVGGYAGGRLSDYRDGRRVLHGAALGAGAWLLLLPFVSGVALDAALRLDPAAAAFAAATALLFAPLALLGATVPAAVRSLVPVGKPGRPQPSAAGVAGGLYALSTAGGLAGAWLTALWLVPHVSVPGILRGCGLAVAVFAGLGLYRAGRGADFPSPRNPVKV